MMMIWRKFNIRFISVVLMLWVVSFAYGEKALVAAVENYERHVNHQIRLNDRFQAASKRVIRLKSNKKGVKRDYQLRLALKESQSMAARLQTQLAKLHKMEASLTRRFATKGKAGQSKLVRRFEDLKKKLDQVSGAKKKKGKLYLALADEDGLSENSEDLEAKADLLDDSVEKINKQIRLLEEEISFIKKRAVLARHFQAADDSPFIESTVNRVRPGIQVRGSEQADAAPERPASAESAGDDAVANAAPSDSAADNDGVESLTGDAPPPGNEEQLKSANPEDEGAGSGSNANGNGSEAGFSNFPSGQLLPESIDVTILESVLTREELERFSSPLERLRAAEKKLKALAGKLSARSKRMRNKAKSMP